MITFSNTESPVELFKIEEIEKFVGLSFPKEYKDHLLRYNGGQCVPNIFSFNERGKITDSCIDWFYAIYEGEYDNLKQEIEMVKVDEKRMPSHILPIAHDPGGNLVCISCGTDDVGSIYFWDHEREVNYKLFADNNYSNLYMIAKSFSEFINRLK